MIPKGAKKRHQRLEEELRRLLPLLRRHPRVRRVILFGSLAKGVVGLASDIDLIVVMETSKRFLDRLDEIYRFLEPKVALDLLVYTPEEFERMRRGNPFVRAALKEGEVLYEADP